jgi:Uri superfamily endonuclease
MKSSSGSALREFMANGGTYVLVCRSSREAQVEVGRLGALPIQRGFYLYVGSAFGPGGVAARVAHHLTHGPKRHWHIDYLWPVLRILEIWYSHDSRRREHQWAHVLCHGMDCLPAFARFGASDCRCDSHLAFSKQLPSFGSFRAHVHRMIAPHQALRRAVN